MEGPDQQERTPHGVISSVVGFAKNLSFLNVLTIALLAVVLVPSYLLWRILNDASMLGKVLSHYEEITSDKSPCTLHIASGRGAGSTFAIATGFAAQGADHWSISVRMERKPSEIETKSYCETLQKIVDHMRRPNTPEPTFPGTDVPVIWRYPPDASR